MNIYRVLLTWTAICAIVVGVLVLEGLVVVFAATSLLLSQRNRRWLWTEIWQQAKWKGW